MGKGISLVGEYTRCMQKVAGSMSGMSACLLKGSGRRAGKSLWLRSTRAAACQHKQYSRKGGKWTWWDRSPTVTASVVQWLMYWARKWKTSTQSSVQTSNSWGDHSQANVSKVSLPYTPHIYIWTESLRGFLWVLPFECKAHLSPIGLMTPLRFHNHQVASTSISSGPPSVVTPTPPPPHTHNQRP